MVGALATPVCDSAVTAISSGSEVPNAAAPWRPSPAGRSVIAQAPSRPRVWIIHQRTLVESPGAIVNDAGPSAATNVTTGGAGTGGPGHGYAGTSAFSSYEELSVIASRSLSANSAPRRKWM